MPEENNQYNYNFKKIEEKWQKVWEKKKVFEAKENPKKKKFYVLEMFAYPSAEGLHMGHAFNYTIGDILARFKRMNEFNVLHPVGYDSLGLPAENAAIKNKVHPKEYTEKAIKNFMLQQKRLGFSYDWSRLIRTHDSEYYQWDQWIFLKLFEKGLVFRKKSSVNYCSKCQTVLANEQVVGGKCYRHKDQDIEIKHLEQWFFKITDYAERLYNDLETLNSWPEEIKSMQRNWIGKSHGININFKINNEIWPVFTTRPDTLHGVTFLVISAQHPRLMELTTDKQKKEVTEFLKKIKTTSQKSIKDLEELEKEGVFTGSYAINPINNEKVPVYAGNFVVADYGCGVVMAVPAHDQRDFDFAKKYNLKIKQVIGCPNPPNAHDWKTGAYTKEGNLVNSDKFNGLNSKEAIKEISDYLEKNKLGKRITQYKLRDWLISRQRYWGTPIPIVYCDKCGIVPVPEKDLPIKLPEKVTFGNGNPLLTNEEWIKTKCPKCKGNAKRETDTMDTFVNSSWYFLRFTDANNKNKAFDSKKADYWMPIDFYTGGREHATGHLIYSRFYTKFLKDIKMIKNNEHSIKLFNQGMVHGKDGMVMSKSRGNGVDPLEVIEKNGADALRLFLVSTASPDRDTSWDDRGVESSQRFVENVYKFFSEFKPVKKISERLESKLNQTIKEVTEYIEDLKYNLAVIKLRQFFEYLFEKEKQISKDAASSSIRLLSPFAPHIAEELWEKLGNKTLISLEEWPIADEKKINPEFEKEEQSQDKLRDDVRNIIRILNKQPKNIYIYAIPKELETYKSSIEAIEKEHFCKVQIFAVNDKSKIDPQNKSQKAKPGKPAIYVE